MSNQYPTIYEATPNSQQQKAIDKILFEVETWDFSSIRPDNYEFKTILVQPLWADPEQQKRHGDLFLTVETGLVDDDGTSAILFRRRRNATIGRRGGIKTHSTKKRKMVSGLSAFLKS